MLLTAVLVVATVTSVYAASSDDVARMSVADLKALFDSGTTVVVVDNRPKSDFDRQRIKGSVSLPWGMDVAPEAKKLFSPDKFIVTYCACGPGESDSADVASQLLNAGFTKVKTLKDGWEAWEAAGYPIEKGKSK